MTTKNLKKLQVNRRYKWYRKTALVPFFCALFLSEVYAGPFSWPIKCPDGSKDSCIMRTGLPDVQSRNQAYNCNAPGYLGHTGTDFSTDPRSTALGTEIVAAAAGVVWFASDGKYDDCPSDHPDCVRLGKAAEEFAPGLSRGVRTCQQLRKRPGCRNDLSPCYWCFDGGNQVVIGHEQLDGIFATYYAHMKTNSVRVRVGQKVERGQVLGLVGSSGRSTAPHLHFEVWGQGYYQALDPWAGKCGPNTGPSLWLDEGEDSGHWDRPPPPKKKQRSFSQFD